MKQFPTLFGEGSGTAVVSLNFIWDGTILGEASVNGKTIPGNTKKKAITLSGGIWVGKKTKKVQENRWHLLEYY